MSLHNFPSYSTTFIGRDEELDELSQLLVDSSCRLLTLIGLGGIGKTRLAIELARQVEDEFPDGVYFVPLQPLQSADDVVQMVRIAIRIDSIQSPRENFLTYLQGKRLLFVFDNFEHVTDGADLVTDILNCAPGVQILMTSRQPLRLQGEWLRSVSGLEYPNGTSTNAYYSAIELFLERAQRLRRDIMSESHEEAITRICKLVEGMPLALELAAGWATVLACHEIADELEHNQSILSTRMTDIPERHRSMQAVFDQSWHLLSEAEQRVMQRFSVFRGGCTREAAEQVAGASLPILAGLVGKSLLRHDPQSGRYDIQELLRQYAAECLEVSGDGDNARNSHLAYYPPLIQSLQQTLHGPNWCEVSHKIEIEYGNATAAWNWALERKDVAPIEQLMGSLWHMGTDRARAHEVRPLFAAAIEKLQHDTDNEAMMGHLLTLQARCDFILQKPDLALPASYRSLAMARKRNDPHEVLFALRGLSWTLIYTEAYEEAENTVEESIELAEHLDEQIQLGLALCQLAHVKWRRGKPQASLDALERGLEIWQAWGATRDYFETLYLKATLLMHCGQWEEAENCFSMSRAFQREIKRAISEFRALLGLTLVTLTQGKIDKVHALNEEIHQFGTQTLVAQMPLYNTRRFMLSVTSLIAEINGRYTEALELSTQAVEDLRQIPVWDMEYNVPHAWVLCSLNRCEEAIPYLDKILNYALETGASGDLLFVLSGYARVYYYQQRYVETAELIGLVLTHPNSPRGFLEQHALFSQMCADVEAQLGQSAYAKHWQGGSQMDARELATRVLNEFQPKEIDHVDEVNLALPNPLTQRELEVLLLMAENLTNPQIAERLFITSGTVKGHVNKILHKLNVTSRKEAVSHAHKLRLV